MSRKVRFDHESNYRFHRVHHKNSSSLTCRFQRTYQIATLCLLTNFVSRRLVTICDTLSTIKEIRIFEKVFRYFWYRIRLFVSSRIWSFPLLRTEWWQLVWLNTEFSETHWETLVSCLKRDKCYFWTSCDQVKSIVIQSSVVQRELFRVGLSRILYPRTSWTPDWNEMSALPNALYAT